MSDINVRKGKHLTIADRMFIEDALNNQLPLTEISKRLGKDPTTISKEYFRQRVYILFQWVQKNGSYFFNQGYKKKSH